MTTLRYCGRLTAPLRRSTAESRLFRVWRWLHGEVPRVRYFAQPAVRIGGTLVCDVLARQARRRDLVGSLFPRCLSFWKT
jgi:hypothetical protein